MDILIVRTTGGKMKKNEHGDRTCECCAGESVAIAQHRDGDGWGDICQGCIDRGMADVYEYYEQEDTE